MPFPDSPRVIYRKNPLAEVICQFRFPTILRIESEPPARLQEKIRQDYPLYTEASTPTLALPANVPPEIAKMFQGMAPTRGAAVRHEFASADRAWSATITRDAIALKTTHYRSWDEFRPRISALSDAFVGEYKPAFYIRIGLRYVDVIQRSTLGLERVPWSNLLKPPIAGELSAPEITEEIESAARELLIRLNDKGGRVMIRHGIGLAEPTNEPCFLIDSDFHTEQRTETGHALETLDEFNRTAGKLFRWCIQDRLHDVLEPQPADR